MDDANADCVCGLQITLLEPPPEREGASWKKIRVLFF